MIKMLWTDQAGAVVSAELLLLATGLVLGVLVGLKSVRDAVVTELADVAQSVANYDQSYSFSGISGHQAASAGAFFIDTVDYCDTSADEAVGNLFAGADSRCVNVGDSVNGGGAFNPTDDGTPFGNSIGEGPAAP